MSIEVKVMTLSMIKQAAGNVRKVTQGLRGYRALREGD